MIEGSIYVGLDLSLTSSGVCTLRGDEIRMETVKTTPKTGGTDMGRLRYITDEIDKRVPADVSMVCVEDYFIPYQPRQVGAAMSMIKVGTLVRMMMWGRGVPFFVISGMQLKKFATGKSQCPKDQVMMHVLKRWGVEPGNNDEADAFVLSKMAQDLVERPEDVTQFQKDVRVKVLHERPSYHLPEGFGA